MDKREQIKIDIARVSSLITNIEVAEIDGRETIYIHHKPNGRKHRSCYHCVHVSKDGLMVNSNGYHPLDVHDAMNDAIKVARKALNL